MNVLVFAPHADDEILGVGGTMLKLINEGNDVYVCIVARGKQPLFRIEETSRCTEEIKKAHNFLGIKDTISLNFPSSQLEIVPRNDFNKSINDVVTKIKPDIVFIPFLNDMQLDHRIVADACMVALRPRSPESPSFIYMYETVSETGWNIPQENNSFIPNVFIDITKYIDGKLTAFALYETQVASFPAARSIEALKALSIYRGTTISVKHAEAFMLVRQIVR